jgi:hypothetical protein
MVLPPPSASRASPSGRARRAARPALLALATTLAALTACGGDASVAVGGAGGAGTGGAAAGGGGEGAGAPTLEGRYASGARLEVQLDDGGDGAEVFVRVFDTERDAACSFKLAADGELRCVPAGGTIRYLDATCETPIVLVPASPCASTPTVGALTVPTNLAEGCGPTEAVRLYGLGDEVAVDAEVYRRDAGPSGVSCTAVATSSEAALLVGDELDPASFVAAHEVLAPRSGEVSARYVLADDGLVLLTGAVDATRELPCVPAFVGGGAVCAPSSGVTASYEDTALYASSACASASRAATTTIDPSCPLPDVGSATETLTATCETVTHVFELGAELEQVFAQDGLNACVDVTPLATPAQRFFEVGAPLVPAELGAVAQAPGGSGRLRAPLYTAGDEPIGQASTFHDADLDRPCAPLTFSDGVRRCVPPWAPFVPGASGFSDPQCSEPLIPAPTGAACAPEVEYAVELEASPEDPNGCVTTALHVLKIGAPHTGTRYTLDTAGACVPLMGAGSFHVTSGEVAPALFAQVVRRQAL